MNWDEVKMADKWFPIYWKGGSVDGLPVAVVPNQKTLRRIEGLSEVYSSVLICTLVVPWKPGSYETLEAFDND